MVRTDVDEGLLQADRQDGVRLEAKTLDTLVEVIYEALTKRRARDVSTA